MTDLIPVDPRLTDKLSQCRVTPTGGAETTLAQALGDRTRPAQVTPAEKTAGTETALRSFSPRDVADMAQVHGGGGGSGSASWGSITGTLSDQTDLATALAGKSNVGHNHDGVYAPLSHNHDGVYAALGHSHAGLIPDGNKGDITVSASGTVMTINAGVIGTAQLGGDITAAGKALLDDASAAAQRTTLGLGTAAVRDVGTASGTVAAGDDSRIVNAVQSTRQVATQFSLTGGGALSADRTLQLVGDTATPGASRYYGTDASGARGWYALPTGGGSGASALDDLTDVTITSPAAGQVLAYGGAQWANTALTPAMVQLSATNRLLGRTSAGAGAAEELTYSTVRGALDREGMLEVSISSASVELANATHAGRYLRCHTASTVTLSLTTASAFNLRAMTFIHAQTTVVLAPGSGITVILGNGTAVTDPATITMPSGSLAVLWQAQSGSYRLTALNPRLGELPGVALSSPQSGHVLRYDGANWINAALTPTTLNYARQSSETGVSVTTAWTEIGSVTITPASATAAIAITVRTDWTKDTGTTARIVSVRLNRGATSGSPQLASSQARSVSISEVQYGPTVMAVIDTPATTAPTTYSVWAQVDAGASTAARRDLIAIDLHAVYGGGGGGGGAGQLDDLTDVAGATAAPDGALLQKQSGTYVGTTALAGALSYHLMQPSLQSEIEHSGGTLQLSLSGRGNVIRIVSTAQTLAINILDLPTALREYVILVRAAGVLPTAVTIVGDSVIMRPDVGAVPVAPQTIRAFELAVAPDGSAVAAAYVDGADVATTVVPSGYAIAGPTLNEHLAGISTALREYRYFQAVTTTPMTLVSGRCYVCAPGAVRLDLPVAQNDGAVIEIINRSGGTVTIYPAGVQTIEGASSLTLPDQREVALIGLSVVGHWVQVMSTT